MALALFNLVRVPVRVRPDVLRLVPVPQPHVRNQHLQNRVREELSEDARVQDVVKSTHTINASDGHVGVLFRDHTKEVGEGISARSVTEPEILRRDSLPELLLKLLRYAFPTKRRTVQPAAMPRTCPPPF